MREFLTAVAEWMAPRAKAVAAGLGSVVLLFLHLMPDGLTGAEWLLIVTEALAAAGITYAVPNRPAEAPRAVRTPKAPPA